MHRFIPVILVAASASLAAQAQAQTLINMAATGNGTAETVIHQIAEGHIVMFTSNSYTGFDTVAADSPFAGMTGDCAGTIEMKVPAVSGGGNCVFADAAGDKTFNRWSVTGMTAEGALTGTWTTIGGTGRLAEATGGGTFVSRTDREAGTFENQVEGAMVLK